MYNTSIDIYLETLLVYITNTQELPDIHKHT